MRCIFLHKLVIYVVFIYLLSSFANGTPSSRRRRLLDFPNNNRKAYRPYAFNSPFAQQNENNKRFFAAQSGPAPKVIYEEYEANPALKPGDKVIAQPVVKVEAQPSLKRKEEKDSESKDESKEERDAMIQQQDVVKKAEEKEAKNIAKEIIEEKKEKVNEEKEMKKEMKREMKMAQQQMPMQQPNMQYGGQQPPMQGQGGYGRQMQAMPMQQRPMMGGGMQQGPMVQVGSMLPEKMPMPMPMPHMKAKDIENENKMDFLNMQSKVYDQKLNYIQKQEMLAYEKNFNLMYLDNINMDKWNVENFKKQNYYQKMQIELLKKKNLAFKEQVYNLQKDVTEKKIELELLRKKKQGAKGPVSGVKTGVNADHAFNNKNKPGMKASPKSPKSPAKPKSPSALPNAPKTPVKPKTPAVNAKAPANAKQAPKAESEEDSRVAENKKKGKFHDAGESSGGEADSRDSRRQDDGGRGGGNGNDGNMDNFFNNNNGRGAARKYAWNPRPKQSYW